jgi:hypothetical protein
LAGRDREDEKWNELGQSDQTEIERVLSNRVDLPADGDQGHLESEGLRDKGDPLQREVTVSERRSLRGLHVTKLLKDHNAGLD